VDGWISAGGFYSGKAESIEPASPFPRMGIFWYHSIWVFPVHHLRFEKARRQSFPREEGKVERYDVTYTLAGNLLRTSPPLRRQSSRRSPLQRRSVGGTAGMCTYRPPVPANSRGRDEIMTWLPIGVCRRGALEDVVRCRAANSNIASASGRQENQRDRRMGGRRMQMG
jgi:hypothetical protein